MTRKVATIHSPYEGAGRLIREIRMQRGMKLVRLAAVSGLSESLISLIESGKRSLTENTLEKIAEGLGTTPEGLLDPSPDLEMYPVIGIPRLYCSHTSFIKDGVRELGEDGSLEIRVRGPTDYKNRKILNGYESEKLLERYGHIPLKELSGAPVLAYYQLRTLVGVSRP